MVTPELLPVVIAFAAVGAILLGFIYPDDYL